MGSLFVSDLDNTLLRVNTTFRFVRFVVDSLGRRAERIRWTALLGTRSPFLLAQKALHRGLGVDLARTVALGFLAGHGRGELEALGEEFASNLTEQDFLSSALEKWNRAQEKGSRMVLASATIDPVANALARQLGGESFSSQLEVEAGSCTGRLTLDLTGRKEEVLGPLLEEAGHVTVMTDNLSDRRLAELADHRILILRSPQTQAEWDGINAEVILC